MSKKRARESSGPDVTLIEIYEDLAHEDEDVRLKAAHALLTKHLPSADSDQTKSVLTRLFRGLCSSRKAARLGFSIALTEVLVQLKQKLKREPGATLSPSQVIDILEKQTLSEGSISGQDERDHYFGRLFACEASMKSELLFDEVSSDQWTRLLDLICGIAAKKPWLRQECGWILYNCPHTSSDDALGRRLATTILDKLEQHQMIRTPEGLAIWVKLKHWLPAVQMPKHAWKNGDPLSIDNFQILADVLKDAKPSSLTESQYELQGSAMWTANLHFVWDVVLSKLFRNPAQEKQEQEHEHEQQYLQRFWKTAVDDALFAASNSTERKHWGLQVVQRALSIVPSSSIRMIFSPNATSCLMQSLKSSDRYLARTAQKTIQIINKCVERKPMDITQYILGLLDGANMADFDAFTKTKTIENLIGRCVPKTALELFDGLDSMLWSHASSEHEGLNAKQTVIINLQSKIVTQQVNQALKRNVHNELDAIYRALHRWTEVAFGQTSVDETTKKSLYGKIQFASEHVLKLGNEGRALILDLLKAVNRHRGDDHLWLEADAEVKSLVRAGWKRFKKLHKSAEKPQYLSSSSTRLSEPHQSGSSKVPTADTTGGIALLYGMTLSEISIGDTEAIQILKDMLDSEASIESKSADRSRGHSSGADELVEILLSFASRPSKLARRLTLIVFEALASHITRNGLRSLTAILETRESTAGQHELFEAGDDADIVDDNEDDESNEDSDVEIVGSDVEILNASESGNTSASDSDSGSEDASDSDDTSSSGSEADVTDNQIADLVALEASLASALGTRKLTQNDMDMASQSGSDTDSDADMTDSEMMALDDKLAEVFRHRIKGSNETKKKEQKNAKENVVNFKNRVLDMIEAYVKQQHLKSHSLDIILPLLQLANDTNTKQLATRAIGILQLFCKRCSGMQNIPALPHQKPFTNGSSSTKDKKKKIKSETHLPAEPMDLSDADPDNLADHNATTALSILEQIHIEASRPATSNAHRSACSQTSVLLVKTLLAAGVEIETLVAVYADTRTRMLVDENCRVHEGFFVDWGNWCVSVRGKARSYGPR